MASYDEFLHEARRVDELDPDFGKQLRALYVEKGTLKQIVRGILDMRSDLQESLTKSHIVNEEGVRLAVGIQGQILGIDTILGWLHEEMERALEAEKTDDDEQPVGRVP